MAWTEVPVIMRASARTQKRVGTQSIGWEEPVRPVPMTLVMDEHSRSLGI